MLVIILIPLFYHFFKMLQNKGLDKSKDYHFLAQTRSFYNIISNEIKSSQSRFNGWPDKNSVYLLVKKIELYLILHCITICKSTRISES